MRSISTITFSALRNEPRDGAGLDVGDRRLESLVSAGRQRLAAGLGLRERQQRLAHALPLVGWHAHRRHHLLDRHAR
jgi:hypothetical protein